MPSMEPEDLELVLAKLDEVMLDLIGVAQELLNYEHRDAYTTMLLASLLRGVEHGKSVRKLQCSIDSWLIARSMIEGASLVSWLTEDPAQQNDRALRWSDAAQYEAAILWSAADKHIGPAMSKERAYSIERVRKSQLTDEHLKQQILDGDKEDFSFVKILTGWTTKGLIKRLPEVGEALYAFQYRMFTGFHHWNPFLFDVDDSGGRVKRKLTGHEDYYLALTVAIACLQVLAMAVDSAYLGKMLQFLEHIEGKFEAAIRTQRSA